MSTAKITLLGFYQWDNSIFDNLSIPTVTMEDGKTVTLDKDELIHDILLNYGEMEVLYSNPDFFKYSVGVISKKNQYTFSRWIRAWNLDYNPIYNYDRFEKVTDNRTGEVSGSQDGNGHTSSTGSTSDISTNGSTTTNKVTPYEDDVLRVQSQEEQNGNENHNINTSDGQDNTNHTENKGNSKEDYKHDGHLYGNIGVTTSQQMLRDELDLAKWNIYDEVAAIFARELIIPVY
jgi:hypothetical protein